MGGLAQDIEFGIRILLKKPAFTLIAALALALGIGANTAIFSVADAFLLKPLPIPNLNRLVMALEVGPHQRGDETSSVSPANFEDWKSQAKSFEILAAYAWDNVNLTGEGDPEKIQGYDVTSDFFEAMGIHPLLGRTFLPDEETLGKDDVVVLSYGLWQRRFASDPHIIGKNLTIDQKKYTVVGVMPHGFNFPVTVELWLPMALSAQAKNARGNHYLLGVGLLRQGVQVSQAQAEMKAIAARLAVAYPSTNLGWGVRVMPLRLFATGDLTEQYTLMLLGAVAFVLLIACANVANLQFARATTRQREISVRLSLGASRWRIVRQLLTESILLSLMGTVAGLLLAQWGVSLILAYMPSEVAKFIPNWSQIHLDARAFFFTLLVAILAGVLSGFAPAIQSSKPDLSESLKEEGRSSSLGRKHHRTRSVLVAAEIALALILLIGSGLMVKSLRNMLDVNSSVDPQTVLTWRVDLPPSRYQTPAQRLAFHDQLLQNLKEVPRLETPAISTNIPYGNYSSSTQFSIEGRPARNASEIPMATNQIVSSEFFHLMRISLLKGRAFRAQDGKDTTPVCVVSQRLANVYWPNTDPIGRRVKIGLENSSFPWLTIVGVVSDLQYDWWDRTLQPAFYRPLSQNPTPITYVSVRTFGNPMAFVGAVRSAVRHVDPDQPIYDLQPLDKVINNSVLGIAYVAVMMSVLAFIALVLAAVGVFGVMSYMITERTHEIGIRMALGANRADVLKMVASHGLRVTLAGLGIGFFFSVGLARMLSSLIFGIKATDWTTFLSLSLILAFVAILACYLPARRATKVDPMIALRYE